MLVPMRLCSLLVITAVTDRSFDAATSSRTHSIESAGLRLPHNTRASRAHVFLRVTSGSPFALANPNFRHNRQVGSTNISGGTKKARLEDLARSYLVIRCGSQHEFGFGSQQRRNATSGWRRGQTSQCAGNGLRRDDSLSSETRCVHAR